jgi:prepilin-type N-terminal cleavage/methylation domain-containing protein
MHQFFFKRNLSAGSPAGFSLVELMITIAIIVLVTGVALVRYGSFNNAVLLKSQAYEVALDIRQAQAYGVSVSQQTSDTRSAYGIAFDESTPNMYQLFQDKNANGMLTATANPSTNEIIGLATTIDPRFIIADITVNNGACAPSQAQVLFERPNFDAMVTTSGSGCATVTSLEIVLASAADAAVTRTVVVYASGQITVQ